MFFQNNIEKRFSSFMARHTEKDCQGILVGLSGGADSVVLLHLLDAYCKKLSIPLYALHVNHMIRGEEAVRDENFCKSLCERLSVKLKCVSVDIPSIAEREKKGLEEAARDERYAALYLTAREFSAQYIALAHNSTDNLETVIINIARGSSSRGVTGIPPVRDHIIRPLIEIPSFEIREYAQEKKYEFVTDSTNTDTVYTRNKIRSLVIPVLKEINPDAEGATTRLSSLLRSDNEYLDSEAKKYDNENRCEVLATLDDAILGRVIRNKTRSDISFYHISKITDLLKNCLIQSNYFAKLSLPGNITAVISCGVLSFEEDYKETAAKEKYSIQLSYGENILPSDAGIICLSKNDDIPEHISDRFTNSLSTVMYTGRPVYARPKNEGDTLLYRGINRKIKKLYNEMKITLSEREIRPLIISEGKIIWLPGYAVRDDFSQEKNNNVKNNEEKIYIKYFF